MIKLFALVVFLTVVDWVLSGTIILGGDDFPDHGAYDPVTQEYKRGWKFVLKAANLTHRTSTHLRSNGQLVVIGSEEVVNNTEKHNPGNCYWWVCQTLGFSCRFVDGADDVKTFFSNLKAGVDVPAVLVIGGDQYPENNLNSAEEALLYKNYEVLRDYAYDGGSILSHAHDYQWLIDVTGVEAVDDCAAENAMLTDDGRMMFQGLLDSDIDAGNKDNEDVGNPDAQCHFTFQNASQSVFQSLVNDKLDRPFVLMAFGTIEQLPVVTLNCTRFTRFRGTWRILLDGVFDVEFFVAANVTGQEFELGLEELFNKPPLNALGCDVGIENTNFRAVCPRDVPLTDSVVTFVPSQDQDLNGTADANFTGSFNGFAINGLGCPVPPCETCDNAVPMRVCSQYGDVYNSECEFFRMRCLFPSFNIRMSLCPGETASPTAVPTNVPTPTPSRQPTLAPTSQPTSMPTPPPPVACDDHRQAGWSHDPLCCTVDSPCAAGEGGCSNDDGCLDELFCGERNCPSGFDFGDDPRCCEAPCNNHDLPGWEYDRLCCIRNETFPTSPCPINEGGCSRDDDCAGSLVCGPVGESCDSAFFPSNAQCCIDSCADHYSSNWIYSEDCCTADAPCPVNVGGCSVDADCVGELECVAGSCPFGFEYPPGASCCAVPCTAYELDFWEYDEDCCLDETCNVGEGGCTDDVQCDGSLVCGHGTCDPKFFTPQQNCCVASCADRLRSGWVYNATCCTEDQPCAFGQGGCSLDEQCLGELVCGKEGNCPTDVVFDTDARCCEVSCRSWSTPGFEFDASCCTAQEPCDHGEGGCTEDNQCSGTAYCGANNCPFPEPNARCCQALCVWGRDLGATTLDTPRLVGHATRILFKEVNGTATSAYFTTEILIAKPYEEAQIQFINATDDGASYMTGALNPYWQVDAASDPCYNRFVASIPWMEFRDSLGGVEVETTNDTVTYTVDFRATGFDLFDFNGVEIRRNSSSIFEFTVSFDLTHPINGNVTNVETSLNVTAALTDASVIRLFPEGNSEGLFAEAQLVMVTSVRAPFVLRPRNTPNMSVVVDNAALRTGLTIEEIDQNSGFCSSTEGGFCLQTWRIPFFPETCSISGIFDVFLEGFCNDAVPDCALPRLRSENITLTVTSGSICGAVDQIFAKSGLELPQTSILCNGPISGSVVSYSTSGAPLASSTIDSLVVSYPSGVSPPVTIFDGSISQASFSMVSVPPDRVNFTFVWDANLLECNTLSTLSLVIRVEYEATQLLEIVPSSHDHFLTTHFTNAKTSAHELLQNTNTDTVRVVRQISIQPATPTPGTDPNQVPNASASDSFVSVLPTWAAVLISLLTVTCFCCVMCFGVFVWRTRKHLFDDGHEQELCDGGETAIVATAAADSVCELGIGDDDSVVDGGAAARVDVTSQKSVDDTPPGSAKAALKRIRRVHAVAVYESDSDDSDTLEGLGVVPEGDDVDHNNSLVAVEMAESGRAEQVEMGQRELNDGGLDLRTLQALDKSRTGVETLLSDDLSSVPTRPRRISESQWSDAPSSVTSLSFCGTPRARVPATENCDALPEEKPAKISFFQPGEEADRTRSSTITATRPVTIERIKSPPWRLLKQPGAPSDAHTATRPQSSSVHLPVAIGSISTRPHAVSTQQSDNRPLSSQHLQQRGAHNVFPSPLALYPNGSTHSPNGVATSPMLENVDPQTPEANSFDDDTPLSSLTMRSVSPSGAYQESVSFSQAPSRSMSPLPTIPQHVAAVASATPQGHRRHAPISNSLNEELATMNTKAVVAGNASTSSRPRHSHSPRGHAPLIGDRSIFDESALDDDGGGNSSDFGELDMDISANEMSFSEQRDECDSYMEYDDDQAAI